MTNSYLYSYVPYIIDYIVVILEFCTLIMTLFKQCLKKIIRTEKKIVYFIFYDANLTSMEVFLWESSTPLNGKQLSAFFLNFINKHRNIHVKK